MRVSGRDLSAILDRLREMTGPLVLVADDLIVAEAAWAPLASDPHVRTSVMVRPDAHGNLRVRHHRVVSAGTSFHHVSAPTHVGVGALVIDARDRDAAYAALEEVASLMSSGRLTVASDELVDLCTVALVRSGIDVHAVEMVDVPWFRSPADPAEARRVIARTDERRIAQLQANRVDDGFYSTFVVRRASKPLTRLALRIGASPNAVTLLSFAIGLLAALAFAQGTRVWLVVGALALQVSLIVDCVDGEVARATRRFSALGAWLDASTDRVKEYAAYAGLAAGAAVAGLSAWWIAIVLIVVQTVRHMADYTFSRVQREREARVAPRPLTDPDDGAAGAGGLLESSARMNRLPVIRWAKKVLHMPIGERWLVLSVVAALVNGYAALLVLLILVAIGLVYTTVGRIARTFTWVGPTPEAGVALVRAQLDTGPLGAGIATLLRLHAPMGRWAWAWPALVCAIEMGLVAVVVLVGGVPFLPLAFAYLFVVAYHHYDTLYRALQGAVPPRWLTWWAFGWDGRTLLIVVSLSFLVLELRAATLWLFVVCVILASVQWLSSVRRMA